MISVIIPTYNRADKIVDSVKSVLNQTYNNFELLVIDDGSTDNTAEVVHAIDDERIHYCRIKNSGACAARNYGISLARGEYIAFHDSDDIWIYNKLEKQMSIMEKYNPDIVFCKLNKIDDNSIIQVIPQQIKSGFVYPIFDLFGIGTQTLLAKREVFLNERFDESLPRWQEFELLIRCINRYSLYCIDEGLVNYYIGDDSISNNPLKLIRACEIILNKHPSFPKKYPIMAEFISGYIIENGPTDDASLIEKAKNISRKYIPIKKDLIREKILRKIYTMATIQSWKIFRR